MESHCTLTVETRLGRSPPEPRDGLLGAIFGRFQQSAVPSVRYVNSFFLAIHLCQVYFGRYCGFALHQLRCTPL
jgi:hypothetical protein